MNKEETKEKKKSRFCKRCNHEEGFDKQECGHMSWGEYIFFGKYHKYK